MLGAGAPLRELSGGVGRGGTGRGGSTGYGRACGGERASLPAPWEALTAPPPSRSRRTAGFASSSNVELLAPSVRAFCRAAGSSGRWFRCYLQPRHRLACILGQLAVVTEVWVCWETGHLEAGHSRKLKPLPFAVFHRKHVLCELILGLDRGLRYKQKGDGIKLCQ